MSTVSKKIADAIVAGEYEDDYPIRITKYTNAWGGEAYGVVFHGQNIDRYHASGFVINPEIYWERKQ